MTHLDARGIEDRVDLILQDPGDGRRVAVDIRDELRVFEDFEGKVEGTEPGLLPLGQPLIETRAMEFPLARAWDDLAPGDHEARVEGRLRFLGENGRLRVLGLRTPSLPLRLDPAPDRALLFRAPAGLRLRPGEERGFVEVVLDPGTGAPVDLRPRHGHSLGWTVTRGSHETGLLRTWGRIQESSFPDEFVVEGLHPGDRGALDRTYELDLFETAADPMVEMVWSEGRTGYRSLWKGILRITATSEEVAAARRR